MTELAELLAAALRDLDRDVEVVSEGLPATDRGVVNLVVAPHEYFTLLPGVDEERLMEAASRSVLVATEQPGTTWFETSARFAVASPLTLDINRAGAEELVRRGVPVRLLPLGYHPTCDVWGADPARERPVDVVFMGSLTPRRERFLAEAARSLSEFRCNILLFEGTRPVTAGSEHFLVDSARRDKLSRSKLLVNVHRDERPYFEWARVLDALANGCVLVSEDSLGYEPLEPFRHFVQAPLDTVVPYVVSLLTDEDWRRELAAEAHAFARTHLDLRSHLAVLLPSIESVDEPPTVRASPPATPPEVSRAPVSAPQPLVDHGRCEMLGRLLDETHQREESIKIKVKALLLSETRLARKLEALTAAIQAGDPNHLDIETTDTYSAVTPDVSVIVSLYNYGHFIDEAIDSVVGSHGVLPELVIVDDHSSDDSVERVRAAMERYDWFPIALVRKLANQGLSSARNTGFSLARCERVFVLDADNAVYPTALRKLADALDASGAAFAYGPIERFGEVQALLSCLPWDPRRFAEGNYIDAMSMIRRSVWTEVGGFRSDGDLVMGGWEDFEFWLRLAERGLGGCFVPEFVGRYRVHGRSMLATVNLDSATALSHLAERYPHLLRAEQ
jgi:hypothetical protein